VSRRDLIGIAPYVAILVINVFLYYEALQIAAVGEGRLGGDIWPKTILILAIATCVWEIVRKIGVGVVRNHRSRAGRPEAASLIPREKPTSDAPEVAPWVPWIGITLTAAYVLSFPWLGYFLATFLFVAAFVYLGGYRRAWLAVAAALVASLAFMFLFMRVVYVSLPLGAGPFGQLSALLMQVMGIK
jgi:putative tricarboxylic transport membrane protein